MKKLFKGIMGLALLIPSMLFGQTLLYPTITFSYWDSFPDGVTLKNYIVLAYPLQAGHTYHRDIIFNTNTVYSGDLAQYDTPVAAVQTIDAGNFTFDTDGTYTSTLNVTTYPSLGSVLYDVTAVTSTNAPVPAAPTKGKGHNK